MSSSAPDVVSRLVDQAPPLSERMKARLGVLLLSVSNSASLGATVVRA